MNVVGIDVGTTGLKAVAVEPEGRIVRERTVRYPTELAGLGAEQDARVWWRAATEALPEVVGGEPVSGVAVTSQAPTLVAVDAEGEPRGPALTWIDRRAGAEAEEIAAACQPTRNPPDPYFATAKLLWWMRHRPEELEGARAVLCANGFLIQKLCGQSTLDESHAGLFQGWDRRFDPKLVSLGVPVNLLPDARPSLEMAGEVTAEAADATSLPEGTPVAHGGIDAVGAALEAGIFEVDDGLVEMTGFSTVTITAAGRDTHVPGMIHTHHCIEDTDLVLSAMVSSGAVVEWARELTGFGDVVELDKAVSPNRPGRLLLIPSFAGERTPTWDVSARGAIVGLDLGVDAADLALAVYEGTALGLKDNLERLESVVGELGPVRSVGGGAKSHTWTQIKSDVLGVPIEVPRIGHGAAAGAALLAGMATGLWSSIEAARAAVGEEQIRFEPDPNLTSRYIERLEHYRVLQRALPPITQALQQKPRNGELGAA